MERRRHTASRPGGTATRLAALLACAIVPAVLMSGCSSGGGSGSGDSGKGGTPSASGATAGARAGGTASPALAPVTYGTLPDACGSVTAATVSSLVPKAKSAKGTPAHSSDPGSRGGCSWTGDGKDGYQYRWLSVTLQRFSSDPQLGSGDAQAAKRYADQVRTLGAVKGFTSTAVSGLGDQATSVAGQATVAKIISQNDTVVIRQANVVVLVEYNGAGLVGKRNPTASTVNSGAQRAAKDVAAAVAATAAANS
jgi:hypothetical protein